MRTPKKITGNEVKQISLIARQYLTNASLVEGYGLEFSARELQAAIDVLTRLHGRVAAQAAIEKATQ